MKTGVCGTSGDPWTNPSKSLTTQVHKIEDQRKAVSLEASSCCSITLPQKLLWKTHICEKHQISFELFLFNTGSQLFFLRGELCFSKGETPPTVDLSSSVTTKKLLFNGQWKQTLMHAAFQTHHSLTLLTKQQIWADPLPTFEWTMCPLSALDQQSL